MFLLNILCYPTFVILQTIACITILLSLSLVFRFLIIILARRNKMKPNPNKFILITGATSGFGLVLSKYYHNLGYSIFASYYDNQEPGYRELNQLNEASGRIHLIHMDVTSLESIQESRRQIECILDKNPRLYKLHCLINNAGLGPPLMHLTMQSRMLIEKVCDTNFRGPILTTREFMSLLMRGQGRIVNVASAAATSPCTLLALYSSTKAGVYQMSRCINNETQRYGVKTIVVLPANAIRNTNITSNFSVFYQRAKDEFDQYEKLYYDRLFNMYKSFSMNEVQQLEKMRQGDKTVDKPFDTLRYFTYTPVNKNQSSSQEDAQNSPLLSNIIGILSSIVGLLYEATATNDLESGGFLEAFDDAIRSVDPHNVLYPGNRWYQFLTGPIMTWVPDTLIDYSLALKKPKEEPHINNLTLELGRRSDET